MTNKKRGRPAKTDTQRFLEHVKKFGPAPEIPPISMGDLHRHMENQTNWEEVAKKQEVELSVLRTENDELARICVLRYEANTDLRKIISYLESKLFKNEDQPV
jgi:hypothetical protein